MRVLYFIAFLCLLSCVFINIWTLAGVDLLNALLVIWPVLMVLTFALLFCGFYAPLRGLAALFGKERWKYGNLKWVRRRLPPWTQFVVWASWAYAAIGVGAMVLYETTYGGVHQLNGVDELCKAFMKCRPATPFEIQREHGLILFGFTSFAVQMLVYPTLYLFFERRDDGAPS